MKSYLPLEEQEFSQTSTVIGRGGEGAWTQDGSANERDSGFGGAEEGEEEGNGIRATTRIGVESHRVISC